MLQVAGHSNICACHGLNEKCWLTVKLARVDLDFGNGFQATLP
jgi:hypothetical protein